MSLTCWRYHASHMASSDVMLRSCQRFGCHLLFFLSPLQSTSIVMEPLQHQYICLELLKYWGSHSSHLLHDLRCQLLQDLLQQIDRFTSVDALLVLMFFSEGFQREMLGGHNPKASKGQMFIDVHGISLGWSSLVTGMIRETALPVATTASRLLASQNRKNQNWKTIKTWKKVPKKLSPFSPWLFGSHLDDVQGNSLRAPCGCSWLACAMWKRSPAGLCWSASPGEGRRFNNGVVGEWSWANYGTVLGEKTWENHVWNKWFYGFWRTLLDNSIDNF